MCVCYLVDTEDRRGELLAQVVQCGGEDEQLFRPFQPISSLELGPEQSRHRVDHQQPDQTPSQQQRDPAGKTHLQGVLQVHENRYECVNSQPASVTRSGRDTLTTSAACSM